VFPPGPARFSWRWPSLELARQPELVIAGLKDDHARALLDSALAGPLDARVRDLIVAETRRLLQLAAADPSGDWSLLWRAAERLGLGVQASVPAVEAGLVGPGTWRRPRPIRMRTWPPSSKGRRAGRRRGAA
jgi:hypothetical protein